MDKSDDKVRTENARKRMSEYRAEVISQGDYPTPLDSSVPAAKAHNDNKKEYDNKAAKPKSAYGVAEPLSGRTASQDTSKINNSDTSENIAGKSASSSNVVGVSNEDVITQDEKRRRLDIERNNEENTQKKKKNQSD